MTARLRSRGIGGMVLSLILAAGCAVGPGVAPGDGTAPPSPTRSGPVTGLPAATPSIAATAVPGTPAPAAAPPTPSPAVGTAWVQVVDADLASAPYNGMMDGVIAGGPGAIAWGYRYGPPAKAGALPAARGPQIWTTTDGRDWVPANVEAPTDAHSAQPGGVIDIARAPSGYVAVGTYFRVDDGLAVIVWTSADGRSWRRIPEQPALDRVILGRVLFWKGGLLAFGCHRVTAMDCGTESVWTSTDGTRWVEGHLSLPGKGVTVGLVTVGPDRLWGQTHPENTGPLSGIYLPKPLTRIASLDGQRWTAVTLPVLGLERFHPLSTAAFLTVEPIPDDGQSVPPAKWVTRTPGVYRSTDLATWSPLPAGKRLGGEIVEVGGTLIMVGAAGTACWNPGRCAAAAWRSTDGGLSWRRTDVTSVPTKGATGSSMVTLAALPDGTLVAVGNLSTRDGTPSTAAWVSEPSPGG